MREQTFVIVGASLCGAKAAETLREEGFDGRVLLLGAEAERPYERPALSKDYLRGESDREKLYVHPPGFYEEREIELRTGATVEALDPARAEVMLARGERIRYDRLLLATGAEPRRLAVPGAELDGIHYLRTVEDSDALRERLAGAERVVIVGAGWIGCEVAASARQLGREVTVVAPERQPLQAVLGAELGAFYRAVHEELGVRFELGDVVEAFEGSDRVSGVRTRGGSRIAGDLVVVGVGAAPRVGLAEAAHLVVANGIVVDERLHTSAPGVLAAGDVASAFHPFFGRRLRVEHWANAREQGAVAARNMLGAGVSYDRIPYFFSDQYDVGMEYAGYAPEWDEVVVRGDPASRELIAFWLHDGRVVAAMNVNVWDVNEELQELIRSRRPIDAARLRDPEVPPDRLLSAPAR